MRRGPVAVQVALADDSGIVRTGLTRLLQGAGVDVRYAARCGDELMAYMTTGRPDAVILDVRMPPTFSEEGLEIAEQIKRRYPGVGVLVLSTYGETAYAMRLMSIPAPGVGYMLKDRVDDVEMLVDALERVAGRKSAVDPQIVAQLFQRGASGSAVDLLTDREREVLGLMAEGRSNSGIGRAMNLSPRTVESYAAKVFTKLAIPDDSVANRRVLAVLAWLRESGSSHP